MSVKTDNLVAALSRGQERLNDLVSRIAPHQWMIQVQGDDAQWSVRQMLSHIVDAQRGMVGQIKRVLAGQESLPADFDLNRWNRRTVEKAADKTVEELMAAYAEERKALISLVASLSDDDLAKEGRHASQGVQPVEGFVKIIIEHEKIHGREIAEKLAISLA